MQFYIHAVFELWATTESVPLFSYGGEPEC